MHNARYRHTWMQEFSSGGVQAQLTERQMAEGGGYFTLIASVRLCTCVCNTLYQRIGKSFNCNFGRKVPDFARDSVRNLIIFNIFPALSRRTTPDLDFCCFRLN